MRLSHSNRFVDLFLGLIYSTVFYLIFFFTPELDIIRVIIGIPFLFFIPGYLLTALIFPRIKENGSKVIEVKEQAPWKKRDDKPKPIEKKGIDWPIRISLSVGLSLGLVAVVSWSFNVLYNVNSSVFGLRPVGLTLAFYLLTIFFGIGAIAARSRLTEEEKAMFIPPKIKLFEKDKKDIVITSVLLLILLGAVMAGFYIHYFQGGRDRYTELYLLGSEKMIADYPEVFPVGEDQLLYFGIVNHEYATKDYRVEISLDGAGTPNEVQSFNGIVLNRSVSYRMNVEIDHEKRYLEPVSFKIDESGKYDLYIRIVLKDGNVYRQVNWGITVVNPEYLHIKDNVTMYLADPFGSPVEIPSSIVPAKVLDMIFVVKNDADDGYTVNVTVQVGTPEIWERSSKDNVVMLDEDHALFNVMRVQPGQVGSLPFKFKVISGTWNITVQVNREIYLVRTITVT